ncbi:virion glycoprotein [Astegopteryx formosana nege-like virus 1]|nr:virion glycoprotein [Astegopteryx formosana nege-like virus 1]
MFFKLLLGFSLLTLINSAQLYSRWLENGYFGDNITLPLLSFKYAESSIGQYSRSPFVFEKSCISVVKTNTLLEVDCQLPQHCGLLHHKKVPQGWFGQEVILCYSFHQSTSGNPLKVSTLDFSTTSFTYQSPSGPITVEDWTTVDFFSHVYLLSVSGSFGITPRICLDHYTSSNDNMPQSVQFEFTESQVCVHQSLHPETDCEVKWFESLDELITSYDYPVAYRGNPYELTIHMRYGNQDPNSAVYASSHNSTHVFSISNGKTFASSVGLSHMYLHGISSPENYIVIVDPSPLKVNQSFCYPIQSVYKNPLSAVINSIIDALEPIILKLLTILEQYLEKLLKILIKAFLILFKLIYELINALLTQEIITALICSIAVYLYFKDYIITLISFAVFCFLLYCVF